MRCTFVAQTSHSLWTPTGPPLMMIVGFIFLLLLTDGESSNCNRSYVDVVKSLKLNNKESTMTQPVINHTEPMEVRLDVLIYAILDVNEKEQKFISYLWVDMFWTDDYISWDPEQFCSIYRIRLSTKALWKPDITIEEMTEKDKASQTPYLIVYDNGRVWLRNDMVVVSTCRMQVWKFPFDIQNCDLTFKSISYTIEEIKLLKYSDLTEEWTRKMMRTQSEWLFIDINISNKTVDNFGLIQSELVYTISMKRRSLLYVVNFLLPVLFFLCLDFSSFMILDGGGEKLSFKVTVLLAVTVLQLILNEILPSSSDRIPLIAIYCIGSFGLMMLSLLETILVTYLMGKDSVYQDEEEDKKQSLSEDCEDKQDKVSLFDSCRDVSQLIHCVSTTEVSPCETPSEKLPVAKEESSSQLMDDFDHDFEKLSRELREVVKTLALPHNSREEEGKLKSGYWTRIAKKIHKIFFIFYVLATVVFLVYMVYGWASNEQ